MQWHVKLPSHNNSVFGVHIPPEIQAIVVFNVDLYPGLHSKSHVCPGYGAQLGKLKFGRSVGHWDTNKKNELQFILKCLKALL